MKSANDELLKGFIDLVNKGVAAYSITFQAGGMVLSGELVSEREYTQALDKANFIHIAASGVKTGVFSAQQAAEFVENNVQSSVKGTESPHPAEIYLHIKNVVFMLPVQANMVPADFPYWRYALSQINGWTIGHSSTSG